MQPGTRLEHYEIVEAIGEGGMGAVYRAQDTRLKRPVAIKVLPPELAADPERLARLEREAQLLASLNHPNVATVHGLGQDSVQEDGRQRPVTFLVMELVEGPSLHDRIAEGPLPWREAVGIAAGIAAGLEAAHERGIVHRDLKPANVHVTEDGTVKVLDFGLAKAFEGEASTGSLELSASPTVAAATRTGMILGTAAYMSPEQARGKTVDKRSDIWALGCVLYEMLAGHKAFQGDTVSDVLASILKDAPDLDALPPVPVRVRHLLERCLAKQPSQRTRDVGDARLELEAAARERARPITAGAASTGIPVPFVVAATVLALILGAVAALVWRGGTAPAAEMQLIVSPDSISAGPRSLAVSPDGSWVAETGVDAGIRIRSLDEIGWRAIADTGGALALTFDASGGRVYFVRLGAETLLQSVGLDGSTPTTEGVLGNGAGSVFRGLDGSIMASSTEQSGNYTIYRRAPEGGLDEVASGTVENATVLVTAQLAVDRWLGWTFRGPENLGLIVIAADPGDNREILEGYRTPVSLGDGRILAVDSRARLVSARLDPRTGTVSSQPVIQLENLALASGVAGAYDVSDSGLLVYAHGASGQLGTVLSWLGSSGTVETISERAGDYQVDSRVSPDGSRLALEVVGEAGTVSVWIHELDRDVQTALAPGLQSSFPVWSPDGRDLAFLVSGDEETPGIYRAPADRSAPPQLLLANPEGGFALPTDWSPDGKLIFYTDSTSLTRNEDAERNDLWLLPTDGSEPRPFLATPSAEVDGRFSPDGRWVAYQSNQTGRYEVYARPLDGGGEVRISAEGGTSPEWNPAGGQIFFQRDRQILVVDFDAAQGRPRVSAERPLTQIPELARASLWSPHPDGDRFLIATPADAGADNRSIRAILNWSVLRR